MSPSCRIRQARGIEASELSKIAVRAKGQWGYSQRQLVAWRDALTVSPHDVAAYPTFVAERDSVVAGWYQLDADARSLEHLWVDPPFMGIGIGRALLTHAGHQAREAGRAVLHIDADPHALGFYLACGAAAVGEVSAPTFGNPDRVRPQLQLRVLQD